MQERRQHIRMETPVLVQFPHPETMKTERSFTQDVSATGIRFPTAVRLRVGQEMPLALQLPFLDATMHATARVLWVREISRHGAPQYEIGAQFRWIEDPDRQQLVVHLSGLLRRRV